MEEPEEKQLVEKAKSDPEAFTLLYERYYSPIFSYILKRTANVEIAEDITSVVFLKVLKNIWRFKWKGISFSSWIYKIATNEISNFYRKKRKIISLNEIREIKSSTDPLGEVIKAQEELERNKEFLDLHKKISQLPIKYQEVIYLRYFENKKIKEICEILGKREGTVKSLLHRGIERLRKLFD